MKTLRCRWNPRGSFGMALIELMVALSISGFLVSGLVQIASSARSSFRLQENMAGMQENARYAIGVLAPAIRQAGFSSQPWKPDLEITAIAFRSIDGVSAKSDRLAVRSWSDLNCYDNSNPDKDAAGLPLFYLKESVFDLNARNELTHNCSYGPDELNMRTQIRRLGLVQNVEAFQVLYAEDSDADGEADRWVRGGQWLDVRNVLGIQLGLLLSSSEATVESESLTFSVLDAVFEMPADGKLRRVEQVSIAIRGQST